MKALTKIKELKIGIKLSKLNFDLSKTETLLCSKAYFKTELFDCFDNVCVFTVKTKNVKKIFNWLNRLAFAKEAYVISEKKSWEKYFFVYAKLFDIKTGKNSCFKIHNKTSNPDIVKEIANKIVKNSFSNKVCMKNPDLSFFVFQKYSGIRFWENKERFESRRAHLKSAPHPTGLNPRVARAMINLSSAKHEVLDPFCGSGGILEEAKIIGLDYYGVDISEEMIKRAEINLKTPRGLFFMDAFSWSEKVECVVTDVPYGKSSLLEHDLESLSEKLFKHFNSLTDKIVVCLPSNVNIKKTLKKQDWKLLFSFELYVHKSLTRTLYVVERKKIIS